MISAREALARLTDGNRRMLAGAAGLDRDRASPARRAALVAGQEPFAVILGCSDSRVSPAIIFDQGPGDLFVVRVGGNIAKPTQIGSVEFAVGQFGTPLVVVLGHSHCGAVAVTIQQLREPAVDVSENLLSIVDTIGPAVGPFLALDPGLDQETLMAQAVRANVEASVDRLQHASPVIEERIRSGDLQVIGAEYCLESGVVEFHE